MRRPGRIIAALLCSAMLAGCLPAPEPEDLQLTTQTMVKRQQQTRIFPTGDEARVLAASSAVLQDLGFLIDESDLELGLLVAWKERSAIQPAEVTISIILAILAQTDPIYSERQRMRVCLVTTPQTATVPGVSVRVTFQRIVYNNKGGVAKREALGTPAIYEEFFAKLSSALFLEGQTL
jgi:hypothetical protein